MLPPEEGVLFTEDAEVVGLSAHSGTTDGHSSFSGTNSMNGSAIGHAHSRMQATNDNESESTSLSNSDTVGLSETGGWSSGRNEGHGIAQQTGESEAFTRGTNRSTTRGNTVTNSESVTDGYSDTVSKTVTRGEAFTHGEAITHGKSVTVSPFYEYVREEIETPNFLTPEEQKLLVMQKLSRIPKQHFLVKAPESSDCIIRAPYVGDPSITKRRLAAGLQTVYGALPCYTRLEQHTNDDVIDVEVREVLKPQLAAALPSPTADDEPIFWQPTPSPGGRQEKS